MNSLHERLEVGDLVSIWEGNELSLSSVAVVYGSALLIGSVFEDHFLQCNYASTQP